MTKPHFSSQLFELISHLLDSHTKPGQTLFFVPVLSSAHAISYQNPFGPETLIFISTFWVHTTSRWTQVFFGPTNLSFHTQVRSHASVYWTIIIPFHQSGPSYLPYFISFHPLDRLIALYSLSTIHTTLIELNSSYLVPFYQSFFIQPSELCITYVILSVRSYYM